MDLPAVPSPALGARSTPCRCHVVPPSSGPGAIIRPSVIERIGSRSARVTTVAAPAGYGKTTHVAEWATAADVPVVWVDLEPIDNDPAVLLDVLFEALRCVTDFDPQAVAVVHPTSTHTATPVAPELGRAIRRCTQPFALVLDDVHLVEAPGSVDLIDAVISNVPADSRVVLSGRTVRLPSLASLRSGSNLTEIGQAELGLTSSDARALLEQMGLPIHDDDEDLRQVLDDTEGWPVGIRLAGLALLDAGVEAAHTGWHLDSLDANVQEYVRSEWLRGLDDRDVSFLAKVSGLDWLNGPLCDHVLDTEGSGTILEELASNQLLVIPLDRRRESFRLHRLLRDVLHAELERTDPTLGRLVDLRASTWFEQIGDVDRAVQHALRAPDLDRAELLVVQHGPALHTNGRFATLVRWLEAFPQDRIRSSASLCLLAGVACLANDGAGVRAWTALSERVLEFDTNSSLDPELGAKIRTFRALVSDGPVAVALDDAMAGHRALRPGVWHALACEAYGAHAFASGEHEVAGRVLAEGRQEARIFDAHTVELLCEAQLALVARATGDTAGFLQLGSDAGRRVREHGLERWPTMMIVTGVSALVETLQGDPVKAHQDLLLTRQNMTMLEGVGSWAQVQSRLAMAEACLLLGDRVGANTLLKEAARLMAEKPDACWAHVQLAELEDRLATIQSLPSLGPSSLSTAELRVLHYLPTNLTIGEIGERLFVSRHTTKSHVAAIYRKLGTSSRRDTVETGRSAGLLPPA